MFVWDTGQQRSGWATVSISGAAAGTPIQIRYAEKLGTNGLVSITGYAPAGQIQTDYYIAKGTRHGDVHAALHLQGLPVRADQRGRRRRAAGRHHRDRRLRAGDPRADGSRPASFDTSSDLLDLISRNIQSSIAENYVSGVITDTPTYEKNGWAGDAQLSVGAASLYFDTERHYEKSSQDMVDDQRANGEVTLLSPGTDNYGYEDGPAFKPVNAKATPIWDAYWFVIPWETYLRHGDRESLARNYAGMRDYLLEWLPRWFAADGDGYAYTLNSGLGDWCVPTGVGRAAGLARRASRCRTSSPRPRPRTSPTWPRSRPTRRARSARTRPPSRPSTTASRPTSTPSGGTRRSATTARTPRSRWCSRCRSCRWPSGSCPPERRRALQEKLIYDVLVTREGHQMTGIAGSRWIYPVLQEAAEEGVPDAAKAAYTIAQQTTYPSLRPLGHRAGLDLARRVLGAVQPHAQPPHVRLDRAVVLRGPGRA